MASAGKKIGNTFVWILLALLIVGLAGFGATSFSGTVRTIGSVGSVSISTDEYARELQSQIRALETQSGERIEPSQIAALGIDRLTLERLIIAAAVDSEVADMGISVGDEELQREILSIPAFRGADGEFDREAYRFALQQAGMSESDFEEDIRREAARALVQQAILNSVTMPDTATEALVNYAAARRSFTWAVINEAALSEAPAEPTEEELRAYYDENTDQFMLPETRKITYAWLTPDMILDTIDVAEADIARLYEERAADYNIPERRLLERLVFGSTEEAQAAMDRITAGEATFETLVAERGLDLADVDMGDMEQSELGAAGDAVFTAEEFDVVGPLDSDLGPALFNIGGILEANVTPLEEVRDALRDDLARGAAGRAIERMSTDIDDLLAGGATLEELPNESDAQSGVIDWTFDTSDGIAAYDAFRDVAATLTQDDYPEVAFLEDGGIFAARLDDIIDPRPEPFEDAREKVAEVVKANRLEEALTQYAGEVVTSLAVDGDFTAAGLSQRVENGQLRSAYIDQAPADFMNQVFEMEKGDLRVVAGEGMVVLVRLDDMLPPDENNPDVDRMRTAMAQQFNQALAQDLFGQFSRAAFAGAERDINQQAVDAVVRSFQ